MTPRVPLPPVDELPLPRGKPQFGMRALFLGMTACCVLFALVGLMGQLWGLALAWLVLMTAAHVAGNLWGTRLKKRRAALSSDPGDRARWRDTGPSAIRFAPTTRLRERTALGWTRVIVSGLCAAMCGAAGTMALWLVAWGNMNYGSLVIAGVSAAVIGGFLGFLGGSFVEVFLRAWHEAVYGVRPGSPFRDR